MRKICGRYYDEECEQLKTVFRYPPYLSCQILKEHFQELKEIENIIDERLSAYENYDGIDFCDVYAGGIQIRMHHKKVKGYTVGRQITIEYDFSNAKEVPDLVCAAFIANDNKENIAALNSFIEQGKKYGWD